MWLLKVQVGDALGAIYCKTRSMALISLGL